jgi:hypothetical protein
MPYKTKEARRAAYKKNDTLRAKAAAATAAWRKAHPGHFTAWAKASPGRQAYNKKYRQDHQERYDELHRDWVMENKERFDQLQLKSQLKKFNLTLERYTDMLATQNGVCAVCHKPETTTDKNGRVRRLSIDHDRRCCPGNESCGKCIRELLCSNHNLMLGHAHDSPEELLAGVDYLKRFTP